MEELLQTPIVRLVAIFFLKFSTVQFSSVAHLLVIPSLDLNILPKYRSLYSCWILQLNFRRLASDWRDQTVGLTCESCVGLLNH